MTPQSHIAISLVLAALVASSGCLAIDWDGLPNATDNAPVKTVARAPGDSIGKQPDAPSDTRASAAQPEELPPPFPGSPLKNGTGSEQPQGKPGENERASVPVPIFPHAAKQSITLDDVLASVRANYPALQSALAGRTVAAGNHWAAHGAFDLKLKASSENQPLGFYENYRHSIGFIQPLYSGSEVWGGYRVGRGNFEPWYLERQTNEGGEFKTGVTLPLLKNRFIDERRAELWRTALDIGIAEFDAQAQLIGFVQEASYAYWDWVAAGRAYEIARRVLELASSRTARIKQQVDAGLIDPPQLADNLRLVAEREAFLAEAQRKLVQSAAKLSVFLRDSQGNAMVPDFRQVPSFSEPAPISANQLTADIETALANRPELQLLERVRRQLEVDRELARNELQADLSGVVWGSQDVGAPTSEKRDKSEFEMEAGLYADVPLQRRKAQGKLTAAQAKIQQWTAKRQLTRDKIAIEVRTATAAVLAAEQQLRQTREAVRLAEDLAQRERTNFEAGASDLLTVTLREQYAAEAAMKEVSVLLNYFRSLADYRAALALER
jgi:outer membrane protein TolC